MFSGQNDDTSCINTRFSHGNSDGPKLIFLLLFSRYDRQLGRVEWRSYPAVLECLLPIFLIVYIFYYNLSRGNMQCKFKKGNLSKISTSQPKIASFSSLWTLVPSQPRLQGFSIRDRGKPWEWGWLLQTANDDSEGFSYNESILWTAIHLLKQSPLLDPFTSGWRRAAEYHRFIQESWVPGGWCAQGQLRCGVGYVTIQVVLSVQEILYSTHDQASRRVKGALLGGRGGVLVGALDFSSDKEQTLKTSAPANL